MTEPRNLLSLAERNPAGRSTCRPIRRQQWKNLKSYTVEGPVNKSRKGSHKGALLWVCVLSELSQVSFFSLLAMFHLFLHQWFYLNIFRTVPKWKIKNLMWFFGLPV